MGLCDMFGLKFVLCVIARFRKLRGTKDNGWLCGRGGNCGAVGVTSMLLCSLSYVFCLVAIFVYILLFVRLEEFCLLMMKKFQKILHMRAVCVLHLLVYLLVCV